VEKAVKGGEGGLTKPRNLQERHDTSTPREGDSKGDAEIQSHLPSSVSVQTGPHGSFESSVISIRSPTYQGKSSSTLVPALSYFSANSQIDDSTVSHGPDDIGASHTTTIDAESQTQADIIEDDGAPRERLQQHDILEHDFEAVKLFRTILETADAKAQLQLGFCFAVGRGVKKDEQEAVQWYRRAAEGGNSRAQFDLGNCYAHGNGVGMDDAEAAKWWKLAADQGDAKSLFNLGVYTMNGRGVEQSDEEAAELFRLAADQGDSGKQGEVGPGLPTPFTTPN